MLEVELRSMNRKMDILQRDMRGTEDRVISSRDVK